MLSFSGESDWVVMQGLQWFFGMSKCEADLDDSESLAGVMQLTIGFYCRLRAPLGGSFQPPTENFQFFFWNCLVFSWFKSRNQIGDAFECY